MQKAIFLVYFLTIFPFDLFAQERADVLRKNVPLDSIRLSDPCILADHTSAMYYMTGTGGMVWKSKDLKFWDGPFHVAQTDPQSWMGPRPMIWAAELHEYNGRYYYFATFTNRDVKITRKASPIRMLNSQDGRSTADAGQKALI
jgi:hypothetical protein